MNKIAIIITIVLICLIGLLAIMLFVRGDEDTWLYSDGKWVKHGVPSSSPPRCGIENCHGLDIVCGPNPPDFCTELYQLGDFCRQFAYCEIVGSNCQLAPDLRFDQCKSCVEKCEQLSGQEAFECENECRKLF